MAGVSGCVLKSIPENCAGDLRAVFGSQFYEPDAARTIRRLVTEKADMEFDLVIFDCDGVLVDSEPISNRVLAEYVSELGYRLTTEQSIQAFVGHTMADVKRIAERLIGRPAPADFLDELQRRSASAFARELKPVEGIVELLERLPMACCVASNGSLEKMHSTLGVTGLLPRFHDRLFCPDNTGVGKPNPRIYLTPAEQFGVEPERCAVVEDGVLGVQAARAAGMTAFGYAAPGNEAALRTAGAITFRQMRELPRLLGVGTRLIGGEGAGAS